MATIRDRYILEVDTRGATSSLNSFKTALGAVITVAATQQLLSLTAKFEDLRTTLNTVTGSIQGGADAFEFIRDFAATTQFGIDELAQSFIKLQAAGITPTERLFRVFADTAAITTDQIGALQAVTDLLSRTTGGGLGLEELERLADRGIPVYRILQEQIGLTRLELSEFGQTAEGARTIVESLLRGLESSFGGATATQLNNLSTIMSNFRNQVQETIVAFGEGISPAVKEVVRDLTDFLDRNEDVARALGQVSGEFVRLFADAVASLAQSLDALSAEGLKDLFGDLIIGLGEFLNNFSLAVTTILNGFAKIGNTLIDLNNALNLFDKTIVIEAGISREQALQDAIRLRDDLQRQFDETPFYLRGSANVIRNITQPLIDARKAVEDLSDPTVDVINRLDDSIGSTANSFTSLGDRIIQIGQELKNSAEIVEFYPDHIYRIAEAQRRLAEQTGDFITNTTENLNFENSPSADYFNRLIESSRASVTELGYASMAIDGLNEALSKGVISQEVYSEAMDRINRILGTNRDSQEDANDKILTYSEYLQDITDQADRNNRIETFRLRLIAEINQAVAQNGELTLRQAEMLALLDERYRSIGSSEERYADFMLRLDRTVRESLDTDVFKVRALAELQDQLARNIITTEEYERYLSFLDDEFKTTADRAKELEEALRKVSDETDRYIESADNRIRSARNDAELAGLEGVARELRQIQIEEQNLAEDAKRRLAAQFGEGVDESQLAAAYSRIDQAMQRNIQVRSQMAEVMENQRLAEEEYQRSFEYGWQQAFESYEENATNAAENAGRIFDRATRGMEDAIVNFAKTGKFEWKSFVASIAEEILRSNIRRLIAQTFGGLSGGNSGGGFNPFAGFFANGGTIPAGKFGVVGEAGPEFVSGPATVTPMSGVPTVVNYNINAVDALSFRALVAKDPSFIHAVAQQGAKTVPGRRR